MPVQPSDLVKDSAGKQSVLPTYQLAAQITNCACASCINILRGTAKIQWLLRIVKVGMLVRGILDLRNTLASRALAIALIALVVGLLVWSFATDGIVRLLLRSDLTAVEKVAALQAFFHQFGMAAPLAYVGFVMVEVIVAPIPGTMLYAPGGVIFGGFWGGALSLAGNVLGAGIACLLMRVFLRERAETYLAHSSLAPYEESITRRGTWVIFLLRVNPLTSSDLVSYAAGLTRLPVWKVMLATLAGMAPLCFAQAYLAEGLMTAFPHLIYPLLTLCAVYAMVVIWVLSRLVKRSRLAARDKS